MLDLRQLRDQLDDFQDHQEESADRRGRQCRRAQALLEICHEKWREVQEAVQRAQPRQLVAEMREPPAETHSVSERPTPITVAATDGSQVYPDRHVEPMFFLLNVSRVALQYGTTEDALLETVPSLHFRERVHEHLDVEIGPLTSELVSALRDELELKHLLSVARAARRDGRPLVALADGTLIRWMIRGMNNEALENELIARYTEYLEGFRTDDLPLASYVSMPATTEVVNLLRFVGGELSVDPPEFSSMPSASPPLDGLLDRHVVDMVLEEGERSAVFVSASHIQRTYPPGTDICFFYLKVPTPGRDGEVARVEVPRWVIEERELLDRIHATVLRESVKGEGYPLALAEAHERAVIRAPEREAFYRLLERRLQRAGLGPKGSRKRRSKQRPRV